MQRPRAFSHGANPRTGVQTLLNRMQRKPILRARQAGYLRQLRARIKHGKFRRIGKPLTATGINKTLRRAVLRENHRMPLQLNMKIADLRQPFHLADGNPIHQPPSVYQHPVQAKRMVRRDKQIPRRHIPPQRMPPDTYRQNFPIINKWRAIMPHPNPFYRRGTTPKNLHTIANPQALHGNIPTHRGNARPGGKARWPTPGHLHGIVQGADN